MLSSAQYPLLLMPVKLETRYVVIKEKVSGRVVKKHELWVRIFPDRIFQDSFQPELTAEEKKDKVHYQPELESNDHTRQLNAWSALVKKYGVRRASWIINPSSNDVITENASDQVEFTLRWLPDYFRIYLYKKVEDESDVEDENEPIEEDLNSIDRTGLRILEEKEESWLTNFEEAVSVGVAARIKISEPSQAFAKVIAVGLRREASDPSSKAVKDLLDSHLYQEGFDLIDHGTPTNNIDGVKSAYSSGENYDVSGSFEHAVKGYDDLLSPLYPEPEELDNKLHQLAESISKEQLENQSTYAQQLAKGLGFDVEDFKHVKSANHRTSQLAHLIQKATWFALGGEFLERLFGDNLSNEDHYKIWQFYSKYVRNKGGFPSIRIDDIPYGILPVTHLSAYKRGNINNVVEEGTFYQKMGTIFHSLFEEWLKISQQAIVKTLEVEEEEIVNDQKVIVTKEKKVETYHIPRLSLGDNDTDFEMAEVLSMQPISGQMQMHILELERLKNELTDRFENKNLFPVPQSIFSYPPKVVDEILKTDATYLQKRNLDHADVAYSEIDGLVGDFLKNTHTLFSPLNTFKTLGSINVINQRSDGNPDFQLPITLADDWYKTDFLEKVINHLGRPAEFYPGRTDFILIEFLDRAYTNLRKRYKKTVIFEPYKINKDTLNTNYTEADLLTKSLEKIRDKISHTTSITPTDIQRLKSSKVEKGEALFEINANSIQGDEVKTVIIRAPFDGIIEEFHIAPNETIEDDRELFTIVDKEQLNQSLKELAVLQAQIILEIERLRLAGEDHIKAQEQAIFEVLDLNHFRLDAWLTALAAQRIDELRQDRSEGIYFGAYGWVEDLKPRNPATLDYTDREDKYAEFTDTNDVDGGIIHTPTPDQAVVAAMFRQSFSTYKDDQEKVNTYTLNLTSDRIQKAQQLFEGMKEDQDLEALLGYQLEQFLRKKGKYDQIYQLRKQYPLTVNKISSNQGKSGISTLTVINGLKFVKEYTEGNSILKDGKHFLENLLDACADMLFFESGFHMLQGNEAASAVAADAAKGDLSPQKATALNTKSSGVSHTHKLAMFFSPAEEVLDKPNDNPKAFLEPVLEHWIGTLLGDKKQIACQVKVLLKEDEQIKELSSTEVNLKELEIGNLDFFYLSKTSLLAKSEEPNGASELAERIWQAAKGKKELENIDLSDSTIFYKLERPEDLSKVSFFDAEILMDAAREILRVGRSLKTEDIASNGDLDTFDLGNDTRIEVDEQHLEDWKAKLERCMSYMTASRVSMDNLAKFDIENAKTITKQNDDTAKKRARAEAKKKAAKCEKLLIGWGEQNAIKRKQVLEQVTDLLFGKDFQLLHPCKPTASFKSAITTHQELLIAKAENRLSAKTRGGQERIRHWLEGCGKVHPNISIFEDSLSILEIDQSEQFHFTLTQYIEPDKLFPWIALSQEEIEQVKAISNYKEEQLPRIESEQYYPQGATAIACCADAGFDFEQDIYYGLHIENFTSFIPDQKTDTGVAFQYDAPNNEAPNALLLAAPSDAVLEKGRWEVEDLRDIIEDTIDLVKVRMVDANALHEYFNETGSYGFGLPMTYWFNLPQTI